MRSEKYQIIRFAEFELDARRRRFSRSGESVPLNAKAFDLLLFLAENSGRVISKDEIMDAVWSDQIVEESNLTVQISALRTALGERASKPRLLVTIPGKGYQFVADVQSREIEAEIVEELEQTTNPSGAVSELPVADSLAALPSKRHLRSLTLLAGFAVLAFFVAAVFIWRGYFADAEPMHSIAVLPFIDRNSDQASDYLGDGLAEGVIFSLSRIPNLKVMSRDSAFRYRNLPVDAKKIGRELGVASILTGNLTRTDGAIVIRAELVSATDNSVIWGEQFSRRLDDIEKLQIDIAQSIARQLRLKLAIADERLIDKSQTGDHEAFQLYLTGRYHLNRLTDDGFLKARDSFQAAIAKDSKYALAYAGLAEAYNLLSGWGALAPNEGFPLAKAASIRALELEENLAEAHTQLGIAMLFYDLDLEGAKREFTRAIEVNPSYSEAHHMFAYALMAKGRFDEAKSSVGRARELDPLSILKLITLGNIFLSERMTDDAAAEYGKALEMEPNSGLAHWSLGNARLQARRFPEAIEEFETAMKLSGDSPDEPAALAFAHAISGNHEAAKTILKNLTERSRKSYVPPTLLAVIHGSLGEKDAAFELLETAVRERDPTLLFLKVDLYFDPLRSDPRFALLQKRLGLE